MYMDKEKIVIIKGAGDLASAIALRLHRAGIKVLMTDIAIPTAVRRMVSFSRAVYEGNCEVEDVKGILVHNAEEALKVISDGAIPVIVDPNANIVKEIQPNILVDAILAKRNLGTNLDDAKLVIGVGPGFTPNVDCHCCVETQRGHFLGRVFYDRAAAPNTGIPGTIGNYSVERIIRSGADGIFEPIANIGESVTKDQLLAQVVDQEGNIHPIYALINGVVRGMLQKGVKVHKGMKSGDVDPRNKVENCFTVSDKGLAIGGGVLEAICGYRKEENI